MKVNYISDEPRTVRPKDPVTSIDAVYVYNPDRLARRYAHQVMLLEEFAAHHVEVVFLQAPTDHPTARRTRRTAPGPSPALGLRGAGRAENAARAVVFLAENDYVTREDFGAHATATLPAADVAALAAVVATPQAVAALRAFKSCPGPTEQSESVSVEVSGPPRVEATLLSAGGTSCDQALYRAIDQQVSSLVQRAFAAPGARPSSSAAASTSTS